MNNNRIGAHREKSHKISIPIKLLVTVGLLLSAGILLSSCEGNYAAERKYWKVNKRYNKVLQNPQKAQENEFVEAVDALREIIQRYPQWSKAGELQFMIGYLYSMKKDIVRAQAEFKKVITNYPQSSKLCSQAYYMLGLACEQSNDWENALKYYKELIDRYPTTAVGLRMPIYIGQHYRNMNDLPGSEKAFAEAIAGYQRIIDKNPYGSLVSDLEDLIIGAYVRQSKNSNALEYIQKSTLQAQNQEIKNRLLFKEAAFFRTTLGDSERAVTIYKTLLKQPLSDGMRKTASMELARSLLGAGEALKASEEYRIIIQSYSDDRITSAKAHLGLATCYQQLGNSKEAFTEYKTILFRFPETFQSIELPFLLAEYGDNPAISQEMKNILKQYTGKLLQSKVIVNTAEGRELQATAYIAEERWDEALAMLKDIRRHHQSQSESGRALLRMALVYEQGLKDKARALAMYRTFIAENPKDSLSSTAAVMMERIEGNLAVQGR